MVRVDGGYQWIQCFRTGLTKEWSICLFTLSVTVFDWFVLFWFPVPVPSIYSHLGNSQVNPEDMHECWCRRSWSRCGHHRVQEQYAWPSPGKMEEGHWDHKRMFGDMICVDGATLTRNHWDHLFLRTRIKNQEPNHIVIDNHEFMFDFWLSISVSHLSLFFTSPFSRTGWELHRRWDSGGARKEAFFGKGHDRTHLFAPLWFQEGHLILRHWKLCFAWSSLASFSDDMHTVQVQVQVQIRFRIVSQT